MAISVEKVLLRLIRERRRPICTFRGETAPPGFRLTTLRELSSRIGLSDDEHRFGMKALIDTETIVLCGYAKRTDIKLRRQFLFLEPTLIPKDFDFQRSSFCCNIGNKGKATVRDIFVYIRTDGLPQTIKLLYHDRYSIDDLDDSLRDMRSLMDM